MFFFTLVTYQRRRFLCDDPARVLLRQCLESCRDRHPFAVNAMVLLPDHMHVLLTLPDGDADFSTRLSVLKKSFTQRWLKLGGPEGTISASRRRNRRRGVWQRRFWEHTIRDDTDLNRHLDYIHYNPVKHGLASCPHAWPYSTFARWVERGSYEADWCCSCHARHVHVPSFDWADGMNIE